MVQNATNAMAAPQAPAAQQGGAQIAVQPPGGTNVGSVPQNLTGRAAHGTNLHDYSGISRALERLEPIMTDADTSRNLRWQQAVQGDNTKTAAWKIEATSSPGLQFYAYATLGGIHGAGTLNVHNVFNNDRHLHTSWEDSLVHWGLQGDS